jgi:hypothetical protein
MAVAGLAVMVIVLAVLLTWSRVATTVQPVPPVATTEGFPDTASPEPTSSDLLPASPAPDEASPTQDYGSAAPIALEAVQAFLSGDRAGFARLAQPEAVEGVNDAPVPKGSISGEAETVLGGPTRQQIKVPTTDGSILLDMVVVNGAWKVMDLRYQR